MQGDGSMSLVFKNNDSLFSSSAQPGLTLDSMLLRGRKGKETRARKTRAGCQQPQVTGNLSSPGPGLPPQILT